MDFASEANGSSLIHAALRAGNHELQVAVRPDATACAGLMLGLAMSHTPKTVLWIREQVSARGADNPHPPGLSEWGCDPRRLILLRAPDAAAALQAGLDGARTPELGAVIIEFHGEAPAYTLTVSRMLAFAAKASNVPVFILRTSATPGPSAAETRWLVRPMPSQALASGAPGHPRFVLSLLRNRQRREGLVFYVEWNRDERRLAPVDPGHSPAAGR